MTFMEFNFEHCHRIPKPIFINFPYKRVKIGTEIMFYINLYMHSLKLDEEQHSTMRNVPRKLFVYVSSACFRNFIY